jgi:cell division protease FtsH
MTHIENGGNNIETIQQYRGLFDKVNINDVFEELNTHKITNVFIDKSYKEFVTTTVADDAISSASASASASDYHLTTVDSPFFITKLVDKAIENGVHVDFINFNKPLFIIFNNVVTSYLFPFVISYFIFRAIIASRFSSSSNFPPFQSKNSFKSFKGQKKGLQEQQQQNFMSNFFYPFDNKDTKSDANLKNITLDSWAGSPEIKEECKDIISYIANKNKYNTMGAEMPKGILLEGPPGTGKTLLAKAIAASTSSHFISLSASEFVEMFVGVGAQRVRRLFQEARDNSPCIIFIDEIDAIGKQRSVGFNGGNDEKDQTLNQLLYEMDGFNNNENIVVMAATNRVDTLDKALLRPGRFDKVINIPLPDKYSRTQILNNYLKEKNTTDIDVSLLAELTNRFSGAELKKLVNEATIMAVKNNKTTVSNSDMLNSFEKSMVGLINNNANVSDDTKMRVAIHEIGHALLVINSSNYFDLLKVSIQRTNNGMGGYTLFNEKPELSEGGLYTRNIFKRNLAILMGGKAAESVVYGDDFVSLGATDDLKRANLLAGQMINNFGMGNKTNVFYNNVGANVANAGDLSDYKKYELEIESYSLVKTAYDEAKQFLTENKKSLLDLATMLKDKTNLYPNDILTNQTPDY